MTHRGRVSLVGAGPGDPELITVKGLRRLQAAQVVVYDALISEELLEMCRPDADLIYAGKRAGAHRRSQEWINRLLISKADAGLQVVRLKGGDPFVFGRGGEEAEALEQAGIEWEVVPGITSAVGVPAYAGIPITHRAVASSVAFITGHEDPCRAETRINWRALAEGIDTLVFLMSLKRVAGITEQLIAHGRPAHTPAAIICQGTTRRQRVLQGTLASLAADAAAAQLPSPALLVVGDVLHLRERLAHAVDQLADRGAGQPEPPPPTAQ